MLDMMWWLCGDAYHPAYSLRTCALPGVVGDGIRNGGGTGVKRRTRLCHADVAALSVGLAGAPDVVTVEQTHCVTG